jgi:hypothetical protein
MYEKFCRRANKRPSLRTNKCTSFDHLVDGRESERPFGLAMYDYHALCALCATAPVTKRRGKSCIVFRRRGADTLTRVPCWIYSASSLHRTRANHRTHAEPLGEKLSLSRPGLFAGRGFCRNSHPNAGTSASGRNLPGSITRHRASVKKKSPNMVALCTPSLCGFE